MGVRAPSSAQRLSPLTSMVVPPLLVVGALIGLPVAYGVSLGDALLFVAYLGGYAVLPGWLVLRALSRRPGSWLRQLALGWALGYALQILAFIATAGAGVRFAFVAYPLVVGVPALLAIRRQDPGTGSTSGLPVDLRWVIAAVCVVATAYVAIAYFPTTPLPGGLGVRYYPDYPWHLSLAADAKHHWPIQDPNVAGLSMPYHYFVHVHMASASQVTGVDLPVIFLRLYNLPLVVLTIVQLVVAGKALVRSAHVGVVAAGLVFLVNQVNLHHAGPFAHTAFQGVLPTYLHLSPSVVFGLVFLVPLLILVGEAIVSPPGDTGVGDWVVIALLMVGASDAKVVILPMIVASLVLYGGARLLTRRAVPATVWIAGGLATVTFAGLYLLQYRGHSSGVTLDAAAGVRLFNGFDAVRKVTPYVEGVLPTFTGSGTLVKSGGVLFGVVGLFTAQMVGIAWLLTHQRLRVEPRQVWLLAFFGVGVAVPLVSESPGTGNVLYFLAFGTVAGCILSAEGLQLAWRRRPRLDRSTTSKGLAVGVAGLGLLAAAMIVPARLHTDTDPDELARTYLWAYLGLAVGLAVVAVACSRWLRGGRWIGAGVVTLVVLAAGALDRPIELRRSGFGTTAPVTEGRRLTPELHRALTWIRDSTPDDAVVAVNNGEALEFGYAAFSERRTFLGGWGYSLPVREAGYESVEHGLTLGSVGSAGAELFTAQVRLNDAAFRSADPQAIRALATDHDVRYLLVDETNGFPVDLEALRQVAEPVYEAPGVTILELASG